MGRQRKRTQEGGKVPQPARTKVSATLLVALGLAVVVGLAWWLRRVPEPGFERLVGRWQRTDAAYVLELRHVDDAGRIEAAYFNPRSIHVARATASREGSTLGVFVELRDVNYPGSTYTLTYNPASDQLEGTYFQAVQQIQFAVAFSRQR